MSLIIEEKKLGLPPYQSRIEEVRMGGGTSRCVGLRRSLICCWLLAEDALSIVVKGQPSVDGGPKVHLPASSSEHFFHHPPFNEIRTRGLGWMEPPQMLPHFLLCDPAPL